MSKNTKNDSMARVHCTRGYLRHLLYQAIEAGIEIGKQRLEAEWSGNADDLEDLDVVKRTEVERLQDKQRAHQFPSYKGGASDD